MLLVTMGAQLFSKYVVLTEIFCNFGHYMSFFVVH